MPHVAYFTPDGKARWEERYNAHSAEMNAADFPPFLRGPWGKLREYAGRFDSQLDFDAPCGGPDCRPAGRAEQSTPAELTMPGD